MELQSSESIWKKPKVIAETGLGNTALYAKVKTGDFPKPVKLGKRAVGWYRSEVVQWINSRRTVAGA
jgi:prophage regulatory protein